MCVDVSVGGWVEVQQGPEGFPVLWEEDVQLGLTQANGVVVGGGSDEVDQKTNGHGTAVD